MAYISDSIERAIRSDIWNMFCELSNKDTVEYIGLRIIKPWDSVENNVNRATRLMNKQERQPLAHYARRREQIRHSAATAALSAWDASIDHKSLPVA